MAQIIPLLTMSSLLIVPSLANNEKAVVKITDKYLQQLIKCEYLFLESPSHLKKLEDGVLGAMPKLTATEKKEIEINYWGFFEVLDKQHDPKSQFYNALQKAKVTDSFLGTAHNYLDMVVGCKEVCKYLHLDSEEEKKCTRLGNKPEEFLQHVGLHIQYHKPQALPKHDDDANADMNIVYSCVDLFKAGNAAFLSALKTIVKKAVNVLPNRGNELTSPEGYFELVETEWSHQDPKTLKRTNSFHGSQSVSQHQPPKSLKRSKSLPADSLKHGTLFVHFLEVQVTTKTAGFFNKKLHGKARAYLDTMMKTVEICKKSKMSACIGTITHVADFLSAVGIKLKDVGKHNTNRAK